MSAGSIIKVMRLPFLSASVIPYLIGTAYVFHGGDTDIFGLRFFIGLFTVICAHIGANVLNEYFDSRSGNDWQDMTEHVFFGGSKVIQRGLLSEKTVFRTGLVFIFISALLVILLQALLKDIPVILFGAFILFLAVSYSAPPLKLSYRYLGEFAIFILFGSSVVAGSYTILTAGYFGLSELILSLPISFLVAAILYCNEVPDYQADKNAHKNNLVTLIGLERACWGYLLLIAGAFLSIVLCVTLKILPETSLWLLLLSTLFIKPFLLIKNEYRDAKKLEAASKLTVIGHSLVGTGFLWSLFSLPF